MGLFFSSPKKGNSFTLGKIKGLKPGKFDKQHIIKKMTDRERNNMKDVFKELGSGKKVGSISEVLGKKYGYKLKNKFLKRAQEYYSAKQGLSQEQKARNIKISRLEEELRYKRTKGSIGAGEPRTTGLALDRKGAAGFAGAGSALAGGKNRAREITKGVSGSDLGAVNYQKGSGFAGNLNKKRSASPPPASSAPSRPTIPLAKL